MHRAQVKVTVAKAGQPQAVGLDESMRGGVIPLKDPRRSNYWWRTAP
jgi:hypothetical protein